jgi:deazaflavin-dependent oxidoreductase (nitroreductase family)
MPDSGRSGGIIWQVMSWLNPILEKRFRSGGKPGQFVLLLTTTGRKSGRDHLTPLQYEQVEDAYYVGSARGQSADWIKNIHANPIVKIEIEGVSCTAHAEVITDGEKIADFLELRLRKRPRMIGTLLRLEGLPAGFTREELEEFARQKAIAILRPTENIGNPQAPIL